jgi:hypothetical protein
MSKLAKKINQTASGEAKQFGFTAIATRDRPASMLCGIRLSDAAKAGDAAAKGADFVILEGTAKVKGIETADTSVGVTGDFDAVAIEELGKAGVDFVVLTSTSRAEPLAEESVGRVLVLDPDLEDTQLRLIGELGLDALVVRAPQLPLTVERLLDVRRISAFTRTALLMDVPPDIDAGSLRLLRDSGVAGLVLGDAPRLGALKERIAALPARGKRKEGHADALLPAQGSGGHEHDDEDWDDD